MKVTDKTKVDVSNLKLGMYVSDLDRPWVGSPFLLQGFLLNDQEDIKKIQRLCKYVYVDRQRSVVQEIKHRMGMELPIARSARKTKKTITDGGVPEGNILDINCPSEAKKILGKGGSIVNLPQPESSVSFTDELRQARRTFNHLHKEISGLYQAIDNNKDPVFLPLLGIVIEVVSSIRRNEDALQWLAFTNPDDKTETRHAINVCILSVRLGHHIGLPDRHLRQLALAGLTFDIGKLIITDDIKKKSSQLTHAEMSVMQKHVKVGFEILEDMGDIVPPEVANICLRHHEKIDGTGYPEGLKGEDIDLLSRIVAIIDTYNAITSAGHYSQGRTPGQALDILYKQRNTDYDADLVEAFIRCTGMYPVGTIIETQTGEVGIIVSNDLTNKLNPSVLMVLDAQKNKYGEEQIINFATQRNDKDQSTYSIKRSLMIGHYDINPRNYLTS